MTDNPRALNNHLPRMPTRWGIWFHCSILWLILAICYGSLIAAIAHWYSDTWSGAATLGIGFSVIIGAPGSLGNAGYLWRKNMLVGLFRWEALPSAAFPALLLLSAGAFVLFGPVQ
jgi:hypothetical protein